MSDPFSIAHRAKAEAEARAAEAKAKTARDAAIKAKFKAIFGESKPPAPAPDASYD